MINKILAATLLSLLSTGVLAYEPECPENAIDAMEDEDYYSHCDYSDSGLNGSLSRFFDERNSKSKSKRSGDAVTVYEETPKKTAVVTEEVVGSSAPAVAAAHTEVAPETEEPAERTIYNIREAFTLSRGPSGAINGLYRQMAKYCAGGWDKLAEWSEPNGQDYYIHYQFQCAK